MLKRKSWEDMGRSLAAQTTLFTLARDTLKGIGVGPEIIPWMNGAGRDATAGAIHELGKRFLMERMVCPGYTPDSVLVNVAWRADLAGRQQEQKWVEMRRVGKDVFVGARRVFLQQADRQIICTAQIDGYEATRLLKMYFPLHPNCIQAFIEYPDLVPDCWKRRKDGVIKHVFFWQELGKDSQGEYARGFHWSDGAVAERHHHLRFVWDHVHYSAMTDRPPIYETGLPA